MAGGATTTYLVHICHVENIDVPTSTSSYIPSLRFLNSRSKIHQNSAHSTTIRYIGVIYIYIYPIYPSFLSHMTAWDAVRYLMLEIDTCGQILGMTF